MSEYIITIEQIKDLVTQSAVEAIDGYKSGVVKQVWNFPKLPKIVRCKDCRDYHPELYRTISCELLGRYVEPDWFCSSGERKEKKGLNNDGYNYNDKYGNVEHCNDQHGKCGN